MKKNYESLKWLLPFVCIILTYLIPVTLQSQHNVPLDQWVRDYADDLGKPDWREHMIKYGWDSNYEGHQAFRDAYENFKIEVIRTVTNGTQIMAWIKESATWAGGLDGDILENATIGTKVEWEEVWSFKVIDGKLGGDWHSLLDNRMKMISAGVNSLPGNIK